MKFFSINTACALLILGVLWSAMTTLAAKEVHQHKSVDIGDKPVPKIQLHVARDPVDGVNVHVDIANYYLNSPLTIVTTSTPTFLQGHAHVFVNGEKRQRLYGEALHIPQQWLKEGVNQIAISLNSHNHENWIADGQPIVSSVFINLDNDNIVLHHYTSQPLTTKEHQHH